MCSFGGGADLHNCLVVNGEQALTSGTGDAGYPGKTSKRGKNAPARANHKTSRAQTCAILLAQGDARMQMPSQSVTMGPFGRDVGARKRMKRVRLRDATDPPAFRRVPGTEVMVAADQNYFQA